MLSDALGIVSQRIGGSKSRTGTTMHASTISASDRAEAALLGGAIGDALGMPTQTLSQDAIKSSYGVITDFVAPVEGHPVSHGLIAGSVTDDTEQTLLLAQRIVESPEFFDEQGWAEDLLNWERGVRLRGLHDLLGPSTKQALNNILAGVPAEETGRKGTTNGASMRIGPVGIATPIEPLGHFVAQVETTCKITHNTREAISAAAAVAAIVSAGIEGADFQQAFPIAMQAATLAGQLGARSGVSDMRERLERVYRIACAGATPDKLAGEVGTSVASHESVVTAFGIVLLAESDPWRAALMSANIGDDTDTIGAIATSMAAACSGLTALPTHAIEKVQAVNTLSLAPIAAGLLQVRKLRTTTAGLPASGTP